MNSCSLGVMNAARAALPLLKSQNTNSRIAIISSVAGQIGLWGMSAYCASKFALRGFADALGMELEGSNTAVTIVYPPDMNTPGLATENLTKPEVVKEKDRKGIFVNLNSRNRLRLSKLNNS